MEGTSRGVGRWVYGTRRRYASQSSGVSSTLLPKTGPGLSASPAIGGDFPEQCGCAGRSDRAGGGQIHGRIKPFSQDDGRFPPRRCGGCRCEFRQQAVHPRAVGSVAPIFERADHPLSTDGRNEEITIITTLLDQERYPPRSIAELYGYPWNCELDLRSIKTVLGMEELRCKKPEMLRREIYYFLAYNLVRAAMCDAARITGQEPRKLSFKNAMQAIVEYASLVSKDENAIATMLWSIACNNVGNRPGRKKPRKIKHRKNKYSHMTKPRAEEKAALNP